jgi:CheY-like chemotaxis protein
MADCTALYIEDNPVNVMLMEAALNGILRLTCELEPLVGLEVAQALRPDIVLLDLQLPGIDGFEVLRRLRADPCTCNIPVVAVTANAMPATAEAGQAAGFAAYLTKPLDIELLLSTLRRVLADRRTPGLS